MSGNIPDEIHQEIEVRNEDGAVIGAVTYDYLPYREPHPHRVAVLSFSITLHAEELTSWRWEIQNNEVATRLTFPFKTPHMSKVLCVAACLGAQTPKIMECVAMWEIDQILACLTAKIGEIVSEVAPCITACLRS
jgi:hypothetical protein